MKNENLKINNKIKWDEKNERYYTKVREEAQRTFKKAHTMKRKNVLATTSFFQRREFKYNATNQIEGEFNKKLGPVYFINIPKCNLTNL